MAPFSFDPPPLTLSTKLTSSSSAIFLLPLLISSFLELYTRGQALFTSHVLLGPCKLTQWGLGGVKPPKISMQFE